MRRKKRNTGKIIFTFLFVAALCVSSLFVYEYFIAEKPERKTENTGQSANVPSNEEKPNQPAKENTTEDQEIKVISKDPVVQYEGENPNQSESLTGAITYIGVTGSTLIVRLSINQYLGSGSCHLSLIKDGAEYYSASTNIVASASTSTCQGFDIPTNELSPGVYTAKIGLSSGDKTGLITGEVSL